MLNNNGNGSGLVKMLIPIIAALLISGGAVVQTQNQTAGVSERMLEVITSIERLDGSHEDLLRRTEAIESLQGVADTNIGDRLVTIEQQIALLAREEVGLLEEVNAIHEVESALEETIDALERRIRDLEYFSDGNGGRLLR